METRTGAAPTWREVFDGLIASEPHTVEESSLLAELAYLTRPDGWADWSARAVDSALTPVPLPLRLALRSGWGSACWMRA